MPRSSIYRVSMHSSYADEGILGSVTEIYNHPPLTASYNRRAKNPPSNAGSGRALTTAKLMFTMAANWNKPDRSDLAISEPTATMATGPVRFSDVLAKFEKICCKPAAKQAALLITCTNQGLCSAHHLHLSASCCCQYETCTRTEKSHC